MRANQILATEIVSRFLTQSDWIRQDDSVRPDAFVPHPYRDLSVSRVLSLNDDQVWEIARRVAASIPKRLHGRLDSPAGLYADPLWVAASPIDENPNHADVTGWPKEKPQQKIIAQQISAKAGKARRVLTKPD
jgi:hypothetical protein